MTSYVNPSTRIGGADQIVVPDRAAPGGVDEAPYDDEQYVRVNGEWVPVDTPEIVPDTLAPKPPTGLTSSGTMVVGGGAVNYSLSWTPPTQNADGSPLTDFAYYVVRWRYGSSGAYASFVSNDPATVLNGLQTATNIEWGVLARDYSGNDSTWATATITGLTDTTGPNQPSTPSVSSQLAVITVTWDGKDSGGGAPPADFSYLEFYMSSTSGGPWSPVGRVTGTGAVLIPGQPVGSTRYFTTIAYDRSGNASTRSAQVSVVVTGVANPDLDPGVISGINLSTSAQVAAGFASNQNPYFTDWPGASGTFPTNYAASSTAPTKETTLVRATSPYSMRWNVGAAAAGVYHNGAGLPLNLEYVVVELDLYLTSGTFSGSGVLLDWLGLGSGTSNRVVFPIQNEVPIPVTGKWYKVSKTLRRPPNLTGTQTGWGAYFFANYSSGMGSMTAKDLTLASFVMRPPSVQEIQAYLAQDIAMSRGTNLITNGSGLLGNNTNFTSWTFSAADAPSGISGSFVSAAGVALTKTNDELFPVDPNKKMRLSFYARQLGTSVSPNGLMYCGLQPRDAYGNVIGPHNYMWVIGTDTTLAVQLKPGDTTITLTDATNWYGSAGKPAGASGYLRNIIFWNYVDPGGKAWPFHVYSRNVGSTSGVWADGGITGNVITLSVPWAGGTYPAGTQVSNATSGGTYMYMPSVTNVTVPPTWTNYADSVQGVFTPNGTGAASFAVGWPPATASAQLVWLTNRTSGGASDVNSTHAIAGVSFGDVQAAAFDANNIASVQILDNAIIAPKIAAGAVIAGKIAADAVTANEIAANAVVAGKIAAGAVQAGNIAADAITANLINSGTLSAAVTVTGYLLAGTPGANRVVIDGQGIRQYDVNGNLLTTLPTDPDLASTFEGAVVADTLTIKDYMSLQGLANKIARGSVLTVDGTTGAPAAAPTVNVGYTTFVHNRWSYLNVPTGAYANVDDTNDMIGCLTFFGNGTIIGKTGKAWTGPTYTSSDGGSYTKYGNIPSGTAVYVAGTERVVIQSAYITANGQTPTFKISMLDPAVMNSSGTVEPTLKYQFNSVPESFTNTTKLGRVIGTAASPFPDRIAMAIWNWNSTVSQNGYITLRQYAFTDVGASLVAGSEKVISNPFVTDEGLAGVTHGSSLKMGFPGTDQYIWLVHGTVNTYAYSAAMARLPQYDFPTPPGAARIYAWGDLATNGFIGFRTTEWTDTSPITKMTNNHWDTTTTSSKWWVSTTNYDADATGGTHESPQGARASLTMKKRAGLIVTVPDFPVRPVPPTTDDPLSAKIYLGRSVGTGTTDPGRTYMELAGQVDSPNRSLAITNFTFPAGVATTPPPATSNFPASSPGKIQSADGTSWWLTGDGSFTLGKTVYDKATDSETTTGSLGITVGSDTDTNQRNYSLARKAPSGSNVYRSNYYLYNGATNSGNSWTLSESIAGGAFTEVNRLQLQPNGDFTVDYRITRRSAATWTAPTLGNSWVNYGSGHRVAGYRLDALGFVCLRGLIKSGTVNAAIFTLPSGFRPAEQEIFAVECSGGVARLDVFTTGVVLVSSYVSPGTNAFVSLAGVRFEADGS